MTSERGNWRLHAWSDWPEWFGGDWHWRNFAFIHVEVEDAPYKNGREIHLALLGLHLIVEHRGELPEGGPLAEALARREAITRAVLAAREQRENEK